jgi:hypothetical protein
MCAHIRASCYVWRGWRGDGNPSNDSGQESEAAQSIRELGLSVGSESWKPKPEWPQILGIQD